MLIQRVIFHPPKMERATNLIFSTAGCSARSGGNAARMPPRVHLAETKSLVQAAASGYPSLAWKAVVGSVELHSTYPIPQTCPHRPGRCERCQHANASARSQFQ